jgi:hypothetical protein
MHRRRGHDRHAGTAAGVSIEDVDRSGVAADATPSLATDEPEVDETAQGGGGRLLANAECCSEPADAHLHRQGPAGLGLKSEFLED